MSINLLFLNESMERLSDKIFARFNEVEKAPGETKYKIATIERKILLADGAYVQDITVVDTSHITGLRWPYRKKRCSLATFRESGDIAVEIEIGDPISIGSRNISSSSR